jgi:hypothetical protein
MDKKIIYIIGGVAVLGIGYYLYNRNKKKSAMPSTDATATEGGEAKSASAETGGETGGDAPAPSRSKHQRFKRKRKTCFP